MMVRGHQGSGIKKKFRWGNVEVGKVGAQKAFQGDTNDDASNLAPAAPQPRTTARGFTQQAAAAMRGVAGPGGAESSWQSWLQ